LWGGYFIRYWYANRTIQRKPKKALGKKKLQAQKRKQGLQMPQE
jgi:hypothetical protein